MKPVALALAFALAAALGVFAAPAIPGDLPTLSITEAIEAAGDRFAGRIVSADLVEGRPEERAASVYVFRMLTELGDIISIRVDAGTGDILEVDGRGLVEARRPPPGAMR